jgi:cyclopropane-fatty-acyl-phospholipid synthase
MTTMARNEDHGQRALSLWDVVLGGILGRVRFGELDVVMPDGSEYRFAGADPGPHAQVFVRDPSIVRRLVLGGDIALAEGYMDGSWDTPDLGAVLDLGLANVSKVWSADVPFVTRPLNRLWHAMKDNGPRGSRRNISHHYDLGNDFYKLWLDPTMTYSSGCLEADSAPLTEEQIESAQRRKWDRVLDLIQPGSRDHILEIGCGWGGFAVHAAREVGCRVTGLTLSEEQAEYARCRIREEGLEDRVDIRLEDYRDVAGVFSGIVSIEMFEAVGERWWSVFFARLRELLGKGGAAGLQVITIEDERYEDYRRSPDFIQRYVFPGGMLPSPERFRAFAQAEGLGVGDPRFFGRDYAWTLAAWADRFERVLPDLNALGFDERFIRMWRYYLAYCRTGFTSGAIDVMQVRLEA